MTPMAPGTFSRGNSSRMMPNESGNTPPPTPWMTRATIMTEIDPASAASSDPIASAATAMTSSRAFPCMSPSRPMIGVKIDAESR